MAATVLRPQTLTQSVDCFFYGAHVTTARPASISSRNAAAGSGRCIKAVPTSASR